MNALYESPAQATLALGLNGSRRFEDVSATSFEPLARVTRHAFDEVAGWVRQMAERVRTVWEESATELPYLDEERTRLDAHARRVPLARGE